MPDSLQSLSGVGGHARRRPALPVGAWTGTGASRAQPFCAAASLADSGPGRFEVSRHGLGSPGRHSQHQGEGLFRTKDALTGPEGRMGAHPNTGCVKAAA